ncbi:MAG: SpoIIE family protein phosphatase [Bacteroidia bacterium]|nr:SpoIIE family protein phosphatase [Bacteroidia bacterium]
MGFWTKVQQALTVRDIPFREIVEGANDVIIIVHASSGQILYANPSVAKLLGYAPADLTGGMFTHICAPASVSRSAELIADAWEAGGAVSTELFLLHASGESIPVEISTRLDKFAGQPAIILYIRDIRERLRLQRIIEDQNRKLLESIQYARRLQIAALPPPAEVAQLGYDSFVIYIPRDIVSGDFYWIGQREGYKYVLLGDCTGHGVPGAMMVMLSLALINQAFQSIPIPTPAQLLTSFHRSLAAILNVEKVRDGADAILIRFDPSATSLWWASAGRPLLYVQDGRLCEAKGERYAIGGATPPDHTWEDHVLPLQPGMRIFLSTDGYADQFGGPKGKKLMTGPFKRILEDTSSLPLAQQKEALLTFFHDWKGSFEQIDDVLIVAFEIKA